MRLTVNLDSTTETQIKELADRDGASKSQVIRNAVQRHHRMRQDWQQIQKEQLRWYVRLLGGHEHRIIDVDQLDALLDELGDPSEEILDEYRRIGRKHGIEWAGQFDSLEEKLRVIEYCNWYTVASVGDDEYALTTTSEREAKLVEAFIYGECDELGFDIDIRRLGRKLVVTGQ